jgi:hypothetical protein
MTTATYTKLKNGDWGLRLTGALPKPGASVTVTKKDGSTRTERVGRILWQGDGVALATISRGSGREEPCSECGRPTSEQCGRCGAPLHRRCSDNVLGSLPLCQGCAD